MPNMSSGYDQMPRLVKQKLETEQPIPLEDDDFRDF
jgi:hypothetical protein